MLGINLSGMNRRRHLLGNNHIQKAQVSTILPLPMMSKYETMLRILTLPTNEDIPAHKNNFNEFEIKCKWWLLVLITLNITELCSYLATNSTNMQTVTNQPLQIQGEEVQRTWFFYCGRWRTKLIRHVARIFMGSGLFVDEREKGRVQAQFSCLPVAVTLIYTFALYNNVTEHG